MCVGALHVVMRWARLQGLYGLFIRCGLTHSKDLACHECRGQLESVVSILKQSKVKTMLVLQRKTTLSLIVSVLVFVSANVLWSSEMEARQDSNMAKVGATAKKTWAVRAPLRLCPLGSRNEPWEGYHPSSSGCNVGSTPVVCRCAPGWPVMCPMLVRPHRLSSWLSLIRALPNHHSWIEKKQMRDACKMV